MSMFRNHDDEFKSVLFAELSQTQNKLARVTEERDSYRDRLKRTQDKLREVYSTARKVSNDVDEAIYA